jgi:capsular exopolysaccharide synthesis family protein
MDIKVYLKILRNRWWLLLLGPVLAAAAAFYISKQLTPIYATSTTLLVNQTQTPGTVQYNDILTSERLTNTYAELVRRPLILENVIRRLDLPMTYPELSSKMTVSAIANTQLLKIVFEDPDPVRASIIANTTAQEFIDDNAKQLGRPGSVSVAQEATVPSSPAKPNVKLNTVLAGILGLLVVGSLAVLLEYLDDTVKPEDETELALGVPMLGVVRKHKPYRGKVVGPVNQEAAEAYQALRTNIHFAGVGKKLRSIVITSASPREGKSTTGAGLAVALAQAGSRVILVDADLRRPSVHEIFDLPNTFGLTNLILLEAQEPGPALLSSGTPNLSILPSGPIPPNPADLLMSPEMEALMASMSEKADYVIYDTPPVMAVTDANILGGRTDGVLLVGLSGTTRTSSLRHTIQELTRTNAKILGLVVNRVRSKPRAYYTYYPSRVDGNQLDIISEDQRAKTRREAA